MGKMLIIIFLGIVVIFSLVSLNINNANTAMLNDSIDNYEKINAKNLAESGIEIAIRKISADTLFSGFNNKKFEGGNLTLNVTTTKSMFYKGPDMGLTGLRQILSIGSAGNILDTIVAIIELPKKETTSTGVPLFLKYAIMSGQNISMNGNINIVDDNNTQWNANVHTNADFQMNGNNKIEGFLTHYGKAHSNPQNGLDKNIVPNVNPNSLISHSQTGKIDIPNFNVNSYIQIATEVVNGNKITTGNIVLGSKENPKIIYVKGDLTLQGNVTGYGVFIVKGNININSNVTITSPDASVSNLGIYTEGNINCNGNVTIKAQIFAKQNVNLGGNTKIYGSLTTGGTINFNGNVDIFYHPANSALTNKFWPGEVEEGPSSSRPTILSYFD